VTPTSQIVGIQTVNNVLFDTPEERYKMITGQVKDLCYGLYGKTAVPINEEVQKKALKGYDRGEEPITCRPAEVLEPELEKAKEEIGDLAVDMDDLVLYAIYPVTGKKFLQVEIRQGRAARGRQSHYPGAGQGQGCAAQESQGRLPAAAPAAAPAPAAAAPAPAAAPAETPAAAPAAPAPAAVEGTPMNAPMPGMIVSYEKNVGDAVSEGETVLVLEAMKMENALAAPCSGTVQAINYKSGDSVAKGDVLCVIG
jgi:pyruvate carboxylase subunit B